MNHKKGVLEKKQHKFIILGDSHARGCAAEVKQLLNNDFKCSDLLIQAQE
jgi:hypothetical protein